MSDNPELVAAFKTAIARHQAGTATEAEQVCRRILAKTPQFSEAWHMLGVLAYQAGNYVSAVENIKRALGLNPGLVDAHRNLGLIYQEQGLLDEAEVCFRQAIERKPDYASAFNDLGNVYRERKQFQEAIVYHQRALELDPQFSQAGYNLALSYQDLSQFDVALAIYDRILTITPDYPEAHYNRALILLQRGAYERGWPEYRWRIRCKEFAGSEANAPLPPTSVDFAGQTVLLHTEQGFGDTLQFIRYAALVKRAARAVLVRCDKELMPLLSRCVGVDEFISKEDPLPSFDVKASLLYLPVAFQTTLASIPRDVPYVFADPPLVDHWRQKLPPAKYRIGIAWQGNPKFTQDRLRSIPLAEFVPLGKVAGVQWISLQKIHGTDQIATVADRFPVYQLGPDFDESRGAFMDTAAVMKNLDLVITSDTAIAHLAGSLGVPVWVALSSLPEWRWLLDRDDSPWYPTMRLFRQSMAGDWDSVITAMKQALTERLA